MEIGWLTAGSEDLIDAFPGSSSVVKIDLARRGNIPRLLAVWTTHL